MSSARKRAAVHKANAEAERLRQRIMLVDNHSWALTQLAEGFAREVQGWRERFPAYEFRHQDGCVALKLAPSSEGVA